MHAPCPALLAWSLALSACGDKADDVDADRDGVEADRDCDDSDPSVYPGAPEACDGVDNDCDGVADNGLARPWYPDADGDGYGDPDGVVEACQPPAGALSQGGDCDDTDPGANPATTETCDGVDNDCDGEVDEGVVDAPTWYRDADGDGYGSTDATTHVTACDAPGGAYLREGGDCDDDLTSVFPGAEEACDGLDNDCDGEVDEGLGERTTWYPDGDGDGWGETAGEQTTCEVPSGAVARGGDCDDGDAAVRPDATDECASGRDEDCDGAATPCEADLALAPDAWLGAAGEGAGAALAVGDLDGDGDPDWLVGAPGADRDARDGGTATLLYGPVSGGARTLSEADGGALDGFVVSGAQVEGAAGGAVSLPGDLDGDGAAELVVAAPNDGRVGSGKGAVAVWLSPGRRATAAPFEGADLLLYGEANGDAAGAALASVDLDGDGALDLLVGAPGQDDGGLDGGAAYLLSGASLAAATTTLATADARWTGAALRGAGSALVAPGDLDGDGLDDLVVGGAAGARAWVLLGPVSADGALADADAALVGATGSALGAALAAPGDADGDGLDDLWLGAPDDDAGGLDAGATWLVSGASGLAGWDGASPVALAAASASGAPGDGLGAALVAADLNGDATTDLAVTGAAAAWVFVGPASGALSAAATLSAAAGDLDGAALGATAAPSLLVGAPGLDSAALDAGGLLAWEPLVP